MADDINFAANDLAPEGAGLAAPCSRPPSQPLDLARALAAARQSIERANALREKGRRADAVAIYEEVIRQLGDERVGREDPTLIDELASAWANQGIAWMTTDGAAAVDAALNCFGQATALRETLIKTGEAWFRYNLAGVSINRGDLLLRDGKHRDPRAAISAYERAIEVSKDLPVAENAVFGRRLALAWLNRGNAFVQLGRGSANLQDAIDSFAEASRAAQAGARDVLVESVAASAWVSHADALGRLGRWSEALPIARRALAWSKSGEERSSDAAVIGLKGRLILCAAALRFMTAKGRSPSEESLIAEATDAAEDGLKLAIRWPRDARLAPLARELFRLGADTYARCQPQFLAEFLQERLPAMRTFVAPDKAREMASQSLKTAMGRVTTQAFGSLGQAPLERLLAIFHDLREAAAEIHSEHALEPVAG